MEIKYHTNWTNIIWIFLWVVLILAVIVISPPARSSDTLKIIFVLGIVFLSVAFDYGIAIYVTLGPDNICHIEHFIFKKCITVKNITSLQYRPWKFPPDTLSLMIISELNSKVEWFDLNNKTYSEKTLAKIVTDIKKINPSVKLDGGTEKLLAKFGSQI